MSKKPKIAIIGLRGIPSRYGGTETFVEELTSRLKHKFQFYVMHEDNRFYEDEYNGVVRVHSPAIKNKSTSIPSINELINTAYILFRHRNEIDLYYFLGPDASLSAFLVKILGKKILINPDGIEWKRLLKRSEFVPFLLKPFYLLVMLYMYFMEWLSCKLPNLTVADAVSIEDYLKKQHKAKRVVYVAYGARELPVLGITYDDELNVLRTYGLSPNEYYLTVARIVAENNIHIEIDAFNKVSSGKKLVIIGNFNRKDSYNRYLIKVKKNNKNILFLESIYDKMVLGVLRKNCFANIHGHSVGGTNPSLLEAMIVKNAILAYNNQFNREVCGKGALYWENADDLKKAIEILEREQYIHNKLSNIAYEIAKSNYSWESVINQYFLVFKSIFKFSKSPF